MMQRGGLRMHIGSAYVDIAVAVRILQSVGFHSYS